MKVLTSSIVALVLCLSGTSAIADNEEEEFEFEAELIDAAEVPLVETDAEGEAEFEVNEDQS